MLSETQLRKAIERYKSREDGIYKIWSDKSKREQFFSHVKAAVEETISAIEKGKFQKERGYNPLYKIAEAYYDWGYPSSRKGLQGPMKNLLYQSNIYDSSEGQKALAKCLKVFLQSSDFKELSEAINTLVQVRDKFELIFWRFCPFTYFLWFTARKIHFNKQLYF